MIYKEFQEIELSALGFGAMRLPTTAGEPDGPIDEKQTAEMVAYAIEHGITLTRLTVITTASQKWSWATS